MVVDILSVTIEGPNRPQLTLVDLPGLVSANTKGVNDQERTMCLAVVAATHDYANQRILIKVRDFDPRGERTMGVITKPDRLEPGSGREEAFLALAQNQDIHFDLRWHVVKNRKFTESHFTTDERDASEHQFFQSSLLGQLDDGQHGISNLRTRLYLLLAEHVRWSCLTFAGI